MKYRFKLSRLDCPNCAAKIEKMLNDLDEVNTAIVNFSTLTVTIETDVSNIKKQVIDIVKKVDPKVEVLDTTENTTNSKISFDIWRLTLGIIFAALGLILTGIPATVLIILSYIVLLYRTFTNAVKLLIKSKSINENLLVTISCVGAYFTDNISEGLMVIVLYEIGKILESIAVNNSRKSISDLMNIKPEYANLKVNGNIKQVAPEQVKIDDIILVKKGEKIPLDGIIISGTSTLDTSTLTGEEIPLNVTVNSHVLSGSINLENILEIRVTSNYNDCTVAKILELVENATDRKAKTETFVSKAAKIYTPTVLILAILVALLLPLISGITFEASLYRALVFLVISCPCAIAISVPLSYFSGIGKASKEGILVKGSDYLDILGNITEVIFDKTGTLTHTSTDTYTLKILDNSYTENDVITLLLKGESLSNHPIAKSILYVFKDKTNIPLDDVRDYKEVNGLGISYKLGKKEIKIGSHKLCNEEPSDNIYIIVNNNVVAKLQIKGGIKNEAKNISSQLNAFGIKCKMFTGDNKEAALEAANKLNISEVKYSLLPKDKYELLTKEIEDGNIVAFVGDGINDAPSIAKSNVGISMGQVGSSQAIDASDVVIVNDDISKIVKAVKISKKVNKIVKQNLIFAIGIKVLVLLLSFFGVANMWQAVFADTGLTLLTILNTTRIYKK